MSPKRPEFGCILGPGKVDEIVAHRPLVLSALAKFCGCTKDEIIHVLTIRNNPGIQGKVLEKSKEVERYLNYGYNVRKFWEGKKQRILCNPELTLRKIQAHIRQHLEKLPISLCATAGKRGDSFLKNAELHKDNPYLITLDLKDAYPSIRTERVYAVMQGALAKTLCFRTPMLTQRKDQNMFIQAVTHLLVHEGVLPQGASTSSQIINIALASMDAKIEERVFDLLPHAVYSRYVDDFAISAPYYKTYETLQKQLGYYLDQMKTISQNADNVSSLTTLLDDFSVERFVVADNFERALLDKLVSSFVQELKKFPGDKVTKYNLIGKVHTYKQQIEMKGEKYLEEVKEELLDVIGSYKFMVKGAKTKMYTPQSGKLRVITGVSYTADGYRGVAPKTRAAILRFFNEFGASAESAVKNIMKNAYYKHLYTNAPTQKQIDAETILAVLKGKYQHLEQVYGKGKVPKDLSSSYAKAFAIWTDYYYTYGGLLPVDKIMPQEDGYEIAGGDDIPF